MFKDPAPAIVQCLFSRKFTRNGYKTLDYLGSIGGPGQVPPQKFYEYKHVYCIYIYECIACLYLQMHRSIQEQYVCVGYVQKNMCSCVSSSSLNVSRWFNLFTAEDELDTFSRVFGEFLCSRPSFPFFKGHLSGKYLLVGGFNPFQKYSSKWESSPIRGEKKKCLLIAWIFTIKAMCELQNNNWVASRPRPKMSLEKKIDPKFLELWKNIGSNRDI